MKKRIAVVMGGTSHEASISLKSGAAIAQALREAGYPVTEVPLTEDSLQKLPKDIDAVYIALHGGYGECGGVQADLDQLRLPYTGPGAKCSALCMDKTAAKKVLVAAGLPVPEGITVTVADADRPCPFPLPAVVKPPRDGSSVGLTKVETPDAWGDAVRLAAAQDAAGEALAERYIPGRELAVSVLHGNALPVVEILAPNGWYDFHAKYAEGVSRHVWPKQDALIEKVQRLAEKAYTAASCRGAVRVDFRVTPDGCPYILEINTVPGCTATSLLPDAAARAGISFPDLCAGLIERACHD